jgi:putative two-component system response regulator
MIQNQKEASILIADDELMIRNLLSYRLRDLGYKCMATSDGIATMKELRRFKPDLVLLDINMPRKPGVDILRELSHRSPHTAVIMVTAVDDVKTAVESMKMGASDYIVKPVDLDILEVNVEKALERKRLLLENESYRLHLEEKVREQTARIRESFFNSIMSLSHALEAKDICTSGHSSGVSEMAVAICQKLALPEENIEKIRFAGLVHDIGKIGIKESILNKPGKLSHEEYQHIMMHPEIGERILSPIIDDCEILKAVRHHHERYDGTGYPDSLGNEEIPFGARIMAVADAYDAMTAERPYRRAMSSQNAFSEIERQKGIQFDPVVVDALAQVLSEKTSLDSYNLLSSVNRCLSLVR